MARFVGVRGKRAKKNAERLGDSSIPLMEKVIAQSNRFQLFGRVTFDGELGRSSPTRVGVVQDAASGESHGAAIAGLEYRFGIEEGADGDAQDCRQLLQCSERRDNMVVLDSRQVGNGESRLL